MLTARHDVFSSFFFQAEDGIRDLVRSRGLGDVYKRQVQDRVLGTEKRAQPLLEFTMSGLGTADEAHRGHALSLIHI